MNFEKIEKQNNNFNYYKKIIKIILVSSLLPTNLIAKNIYSPFPPATLNLKIPNPYEKKESLINKINDFYSKHRNNFPPLLNEDFFKIIKEIESTNNPKAVNKNSGATGLMQVTDICIKDVLESINIYTKNRFHLTTKDQIQEIKKEILNNPKLGEKIGKLYFYFLYKRYNINNLKGMIIAYNAGINYLNQKKIPEETKKYLEKYKKLANK